MEMSENEALPFLLHVLKIVVLSPHYLSPSPQVENWL